MTPGEPHPDRRDFGLAALLALAALACYLRTLAPDVLYSDSAEFQTLAYTLGTTHSTGYPVYLLLARLVGFLPLYSPAWRVSLFSALCASVTVGGLYLLTRFVTHSRPGAALGSVAFALSYTFWSQAIIAEVYTPATAWLVAVMLLLAHWRRAPLAQRRALFCAAALTCLGLGVHASVVLLAPTALVFVLVCLRRVAEWRRCLAAAIAGVAAGLSVYFLAFFLLDARNPPSSFIQVMLAPSRSIWGLQAADLDSAFERWRLTVSGVQWQDAMFPANGDLIEAAGYYLYQLQNQEFSWPLLLCALLGVNAVFLPSGARRAPGTTAQSPGNGTFLGIFGAATYLLMLALILNYYPGDKPIFYLPTYLFVAGAIGVGAGRVLELARPRRASRKPAARFLYAALLLVLTATAVLPHLGERWEALHTGAARFVQDTYPYPHDDLAEPRRAASMRLRLLPDDAFLVMEWRALYAVAYLAYVEGERPGIILKEALPHGSNGKMATTLIEEIEDALRAGRPVFTDQDYADLRGRFRARPAGGGLYRVALRENQAP